MAETIIFGGQKLQIDEHDPLWEQLIEKYSKKKTGWEKPEVHSTAYMIHNGLFYGTHRVDNSYRALDSMNANAWSRAAIFEDEEFCRMQARAEEIRRRMLRWAAENDKPFGKRDECWVIGYAWETGEWGAFRCPASPSVFGVYFSSQEIALKAAQHFSNDLEWMLFKYKRRLDEVNE